MSLNNQSIVFPVTQKRESGWVLSPNRYEFNAKGRWPWLQRWAFWLLDKLSARACDESITYSTVHVDGNDIIQAVMRNRADIERLYNKRAKYLVIGAEDLARLLNEPSIRQMMRFRFPVQIGGFDGRCGILGLEVVVVPWLSGFFVMPDLEKEEVYVVD
jgi:hypothetical protein